MNTTETMEQQLARLEAENAALKAEVSKPVELKFKVAEASGGLSIYYGGRYPCTLPVRVWEAIFANKARIESFIDANRPDFKIKK